MFEPHQNVYHYTSTERLLNNILPSMTVRLGPYAGLNDPREAHDWRFSIYVGDETNIPRFDQELFAEITEFVTRHIMVLCGCIDDPALTSDGPENSEFLHGYAHPRMWEQYAAKHTGVCLVLDMAGLRRSVEQAAAGAAVFSGPVAYSNTKPPGLAHHLAHWETIQAQGMDIFMRAHIVQHHQALLFTKHLDWRDESEHRFVVLSLDAQPIFASIANCIKAVVVGGLCDLDTSAKVYEACQARGIEAFRFRQFGWNASIHPLAHKESLLDLNGIDFSTNIGCEAVFVQSAAGHGGLATLYIDTKGNVVVHYYGESAV